jgi:uncharacterized protein DUF1569
MKALSSSADQQEVLTRIAALRADQPRQWGTMTCHQMLCHLSDAFLLPLGEKQASLGPSPGPRALVKFVGLYVPMKWPKNLSTRPEMEQGVGGTSPSDFEQDRKKLTILIDRFSKANSRLDHPIFGKMKEKDWHRWGYLHCDHHLRQFGV